MALKVGINGFGRMGRLSLRAAAEGELHGILGFEERPLVSTDYCGDPARASSTDCRPW